MSVREIAPNLYVHERPLGFFGVQLGARMTVVRVGDGLLLHSPTDLDPAQLHGLGEPRWVLAPNKFHHLYAGRWLEEGLEGWCAAGLPDKRPDLSFAGVVTEEMTPFGDDVLLIPLTCFPLSNEVVVLHRPSRTLIVTDLVFNFGPDAPWLTRALMWCAGGYPGCKTTVLERIAMKRPIARTEIARLLDLDFDRIIASHGNIVESGGRDALRSAFAWLDLPGPDRALAESP